jgi:aspartyl-tRNA(Asn)/glutamyl-tRNA(Gln) amidotransferase subunit A
VRDAALVLETIAGYDGRDPASSRRPTGEYVPPPGVSIRGMKIGVPENFYFERLDPEVERAVRGALQTAEQLGAELHPVRVPDVEALNTVARLVLLAEASAVLQKHLGDRSKFGADVLALVDQGRMVPAVDYLDAQRLRRRLQAEFARLWREVDCLATPTTPTTAPRIGQTTIRVGEHEEDVRLLTTRPMRGINALGLPALSIPCGVSAAGMPIGMQIVGPAFGERAVLDFGAALEDAGVRTVSLL